MGRVRFVVMLLGLALGWAWGAGAAQAQLLCVTSPRANLRLGPGTSHRITWEVNRYMPLFQIEKKGDWIKVRDVDGDTHWIFGQLVDDATACLTIKSARANIRKTPSANGAKWFTVEKYTSFKKIGDADGKKWVKIEYEGEVMWVFHTLVWPPP